MKKKIRPQKVKLLGLPKVAVPPLVEQYGIEPDHSHRPVPGLRTHAAISSTSSYVCSSAPLERTQGQIRLTTNMTLLWARLHVFITSVRDRTHAFALSVGTNMLGHSFSLHVPCVLIFAMEHKFKDYTRIRNGLVIWRAAVGGRGAGFDAGPRQRRPWYGHMYIKTEELILCTQLILNYPAH